ncbi:unnamed protein product [Effrenium voratum]|uniref:Uncharacterized protein n=1 Tax=Effrenium voratum TaxID=2562239 RepID=A0AA36JT81_9DINO|nr:unnamed protein product [Effrenium voratum]CAJ1416656.1 unnamed protein product [Effrenium voratum]
MGAAGVLEAVALTLRCLLTLVITCLAAALGCAVVAEMNSFLYGLEGHKSLSELAAQVPGEAVSMAILVLPAWCCWRCVQGRGPGSWQRSCRAALVGGLLLGDRCRSRFRGPNLVDLRDDDAQQRASEL